MTNLPNPQPSSRAKALDPRCKQRELRAGGEAPQMKKSKLERAARRLCKNRDREKQILADLKRCERFSYFVGEDEKTGEPVYTEPTNPNPDGNYCSRVVYHVHGRLGDPYQVELPPADWCESCRANLPLVEELRAVRARKGGLMSAMMRAYRGEQNQT